MIPPADCSVFLSLWHHLVRDHGLERPATITARIWERTGKVMFFDTGENEMPASLRPAGDDARRAVVARELPVGDLPGARSGTSARHAAFDADGRPCERNLFAVTRARDAVEA